MKRLELRPIPALSSREEVFFSRARRRRGTLSGPEFSVVRIPQQPPLSAGAKAFVELRAELELSEKVAASAIGVRRVDVLQALERGELEPQAPDGWARACAALRDAHARGATEPSAGW